MSPINRRHFIAAAAGAAAAAVAVSPAAGLGGEATAEADDVDFTNADRGFIAALTPGVVKNAAGKVVWDNDAYDFLSRTRPARSTKSLWRQSQLVRKQAVQGHRPDLPGPRARSLEHDDRGGRHRPHRHRPADSPPRRPPPRWKLYRDHRDAAGKKVTALIYTHPHVDHFGGAYGVRCRTGPGTSPWWRRRGSWSTRCRRTCMPVTAMTRRSGYMYGAHLPKSAKGQVGCGLGQNCRWGR